MPRSIGSHRGFYSFPNVKPFDAVLARFIIESVLSLIGGIVVLILLWWFMDLTLRSDTILGAFRTYMELHILCFGVCLFVGVYGTRFSIIYKAIQTCSRGLFVSAVFHPAGDLPPDAQYIISFNPIAHALELLRADLLGMKPFVLAPKPI